MQHIIMKDIISELSLFLKILLYVISIYQLTIFLFYFQMKFQVNDYIVRINQW